MALTRSRARKYAPGALQVDNLIPVKAAATIHAGAALESNGGYLEPASGAGTFMGFALESNGTTHVGVTVGKVMRVITPGVGGRVLVSFRAPWLP